MFKKIITLFSEHTERCGPVVKLLLRVQEVPDSNLGSETGSPDVSFGIFLGNSRQMLGKCLKIRSLPFPSTSFTFCLSLFCPSFDAI
jgi:hypothetical protein